MYTLHWVIAARVLLFVNPDSSLYDHCVESIIPVKKKKLHDDLMKVSDDVEENLLPTIIGMVFCPKIKSFVEVGWDIGSESILILLAAAAVILGNCFCSFGAFLVEKTLSEERRKVGL